MPPKLTMTNLRSDNCSPVHPELRQAIIDDLRGEVAGSDGLGYDTLLDLELAEALGELFGAPVEVCVAATGTGANSIAIASLLGANRPATILCHDVAHVRIWEEGAALRIAGLDRFTAVGGAEGKIDPARLREVLGQPGIHNRVLSLTNPTELGTLYSVDEISMLSEMAHEHGCAVHLDGARLGASLTALGVSASELLRLSRLDAISFGGTKAGALAAEAAIFPHPTESVRANLGVYQRASGQRLPKRRFIQVQLLRLLQDDLWLRIAAHQNALCALFLSAAGPDVRALVRYPAPTNQVFLQGGEALSGLLRDMQVGFTRWDADTVRLVFSYQHQPEAIRALGASIGERIAVELPALVGRPKAGRESDSLP
jgi:threonine aldolase